MKYETYSEYDPRYTVLAESAFLTLWSTLGSWHADLVLVGGLVPTYLCGDHTQHRTLPRPATLDVDLGIALAADSGQYGNLFWELSGQGFKRSEMHPARLENTIGNFPSTWTSSSSTRRAPVARRRWRTSPPASCPAWTGHWPPHDPSK